MAILDEMVSDIRKLGHQIQVKKIEASDIIFEERVRMNCFYCGKYANNWKCPPKIPNIDYKRMVLEFENAALIYMQIGIHDKNYNEVRNSSSIILHKALLACEKWLYDRNYSMALSFIGGSCKLCKNGCAVEKCANPYQARSSVEAIGINIIKTAMQVGIEIKFPPQDHMMRIGLLLW